MKFSSLVCCVFLTLNIFINKSFSQTYPYKNGSLPVEERVKDLLSRMTTVEKIKQLDMYRGWDISPMGQSHEATIYDSNLIAKTLGNYSVGSIHDFYPANASLSNKVQKYVITHSCNGANRTSAPEGHMGVCIGG